MSYSLMSTNIYTNMHMFICVYIYKTLLKKWKGTWLRLFLYRLKMHEYLEAWLLQCRIGHPYMKHLCEIWTQFLSFNFKAAFLCIFKVFGNQSPLLTGGPLEPWGQILHLTPLTPQLSVNTRDRQECDAGTCGWAEYGERDSYPRNWRGTDRGTLGVDKLLFHPEFTG